MKQFDLLWLGGPANSPRVLRHSAGCLLLKMTLSPLNFGGPILRLPTEQQDQKGMLELRDFIETTGVSLGFLIILLVFIYKGVRAVWNWAKPRLEELFNRHFALVESLITRNEQQYLHDQDSTNRINTLFTKRDAAQIAKCHCNIIESVTAGDNEAVKIHCNALREELHRMEHSDPEQKVES